MTQKDACQSCNYIGYKTYAKQNSEWQYRNLSGTENLQISRDTHTKPSRYHKYDNSAPRACP